jgi:hypothetical protein
VLLSAIGGSGTHWLMAALERRLRVARKPDNLFRINYHELCPNISTCSHLVGGRTREEIARCWPDQQRQHSEEFVRRSGGYRWTGGPWLEPGIVDYLDWMAGQDSYVFMSGTLSELGLLSRYAVPGVVMVVRDPVQVLLSWAKPYRHGDVVDHLGGITSRSTLDFIATRWNRHASEALRLHEIGLLAGVIRFEHASEDAARLGLDWVFDGFDPRRRNDANEVSAEATTYLYGATEAARNSVYALGAALR